MFFTTVILRREKEKREGGNINRKRKKKKKRKNKKRKKLLKGRDIWIGVWKYNDRQMKAAKISYNVYFFKRPDPISPFTLFQSNKTSSFITRASSMRHCIPFYENICMLPKSQGPRARSILPNTLPLALIQLFQKMSGPFPFLCVSVLTKRGEIPPLPWQRSLFPRSSTDPL